MRSAVEQAIRHDRLVAILRGVPAAVVGQMGEALVAGGIRMMEVALSEPGALEALSRLRVAMGDRALVGAGTVVTAQLGDEALAAGAQFFVTPHVTPDVCDLALKRNVAITCGAMTPSEIAWARSLGSTIVKLFPASPLGPEYLKALKGPYPDLEALVVGGIGTANLAQYLKAGAVGAGIGGALTSLDWTRPDFARVTAQAQELTAIVARHGSDR
ncbi:MAG TPA: bifunctional 4-hydroxy-2-oxoglutarate aldolase/2-dehydro-3-deoxy-phosphogluconate aldolase [Symbiobacteriaceae bacterium]|nr:bifunctional 4-hydroxy-2-oxoglutarate aldolase/2-dehydro-3-deoxy-phosphogluconate aldolase [Symbiobacteriaceae bacterium]